MLKSLQHKRFKIRNERLSLSGCYWYAQAKESIVPRGNENENDSDDRNYDTNEECLVGEYRIRKNHTTRRFTGQAGKHRKVWGSLPPFQVFADLLRGAELSRDRSRYETSSNLRWRHLSWPDHLLSFLFMYFNYVLIAVKWQHWPSSVLHQ